MKLLNKVYKLLIHIWNAQKLVAAQPWRAFAGITAPTEPTQATFAQAGNPLSLESRLRSKPFQSLNFLTHQRVLLPMNFYDLIEHGITPEQAIDLGTIINPEHHE